jgi:hypothetical protein
MFILIIIILLIILIVLYFNFIFNNNKINIYRDKIKYKANYETQEIFKKYGTIVDISILQELNNISDYIFYYNSKWTTKNNNYIKKSINEKYYYILDKDYYYYLTNIDLLTINNNCKISILDLKKYSNKINIQ